MTPHALTIKEDFGIHDMLHNKQGSKNTGWTSKNNLKFALQIPALDIQNLIPV